MNPEDRALLRDLAALADAVQSLLLTGILPEPHRDHDQLGLYAKELARRAWQRLEEASDAQ